MLDAISHNPLFNSIFLRCLAQSLPRGGGVLSLAMPGNPFAASLRHADLGLDVSDGLSCDFLAAYAGFVEGLMAYCGAKPVVGATDGVVQLGEGCGLGAGFATTAPRHFKAQSLTGLIRGMRDPVFLYLDCDADGGGLLGSAIGAILDRGTIVWVDIRAHNRETFLEGLHKVCDPEAFDLFGLDHQAGCVDLHQAGNQVGKTAPEQLQGVLLVPKWRWNSHGLRRLTVPTTPEGQAGELRAPLLVPHARGASERTLDIISAARPIPVIATAPGKVFLPVGKHVFANHGRIEPLPHEEDAKGLVTGGLHRVQLVFVPPMAGTFELRVLLGWPPKADLKMRIGNLVVPANWNNEWYHLKSQVHLVATQANRPFTLELSHAGPAGGLGLMVKGVELDYTEQSATGTLFPVCHV